ncbi:putative ABC-type branched-chain amino acid transport system, periplasmic component [Frankia canadensis]|uniref:Putative ABC-type branched-chain amino acid transport system, periplasmic component n=1 Tax=Frankia canadensis TaxID=1836972 RepID=A0A2I2L2S7_9ACTN|nr:ABC transporter substrate-binding protein [Frankia canadensis]SNQ52230.1 putative ABC-type branched-chain amino acid transport system, periplasmic component [Frankia canadensis]SOU59520.1 putative ABC-type branched-chain amino acid transport system, periplasmic component [Frankia canadensis]
MRSRRLTALASSLLAGAVVLAACGSSGGGGSSNSAAIANPTGKLSGAPIKIGMYAPTNNAVFNTPDYVAAARAAVRGVNTRGGVNGRPLELVYCNPEFDPNKAAACARQLVSDGVIATVKSIAPQGGAQTVQIFEQAGIPQVGLGALVPAEYQASTSYLLDGGLNYPYAAALIGAQKEGKKKVYLVTTDNAPSGPFLAAMSGAAAKLGMQVVGQQKLPPTTADYAPLIAAIQRSGADSAMIALTEQGAVQTLRAADQSGLHLSWLMNSGNLKPNDYKEFSEDITKGIIHGSSVIPTSYADKNPQVKAMKADLDAEIAAGDKDAEPGKMFGTALLAWPSVNAIATLLKSAKTIDAAGLRAQLDAAKNLELGVVPPWTPSASVDKVNTRVSAPEVYLVKVKDGVPVLAYPDPVDVSKVLN